MIFCLAACALECLMNFKFEVGLICWAFVFYILFGGLLLVVVHSYKEMGIQCFYFLGAMHM